MLPLSKRPDDVELQEIDTLEEPFPFQCRPGLACFNRCCREAVIILSPYDVLRLSRGLGLSTGEFLRRHTRREEEAASGLPLVLLRPGREGGCPFRGEEGCRVYAHRPAACRLFPLAQGSELTSEGVRDRFFLRRLDYCEGFQGEARETLRQWLSGQGFFEADAPRRPWLNLLLREGEPGRPPLDHRLLSQFYLLAYDLDGFRTFIMESALLKTHGLSPEEAEALKTDDLVLLRASAAYLEQILFPDTAPPLRQALRT